jgi:hypothetical protein
MLVVQDIHPIIHIGSTAFYTREISELEGKVPFRTKKQPASEVALIAESDNEQFIVGSKLVSINSYPCASLTYDAIKKKLETAAWPLRLELERPLREDQIPSLDSILAMEDATVQFSAFKVLIANGIDLIKHNAGNKKSHLTTLKCSAKDFFYMSKFNPQKREEELWNRFSLYDLKFIKVN